MSVGVFIYTYAYILVYFALTYSFSSFFSLVYPFLSFSILPEGQQ